MGNNYGPKKISIIDVLLSSLGTFISGLIGSIILVIAVFVISNLMGDSTTNTEVNNLGNNNPLLPFILSMVTYIVSIIISLTNYNFLNLTDGERYKKSSIHMYNILLLTTIIYVVMVGLYMYFGIMNYDNLIYIFIIHIIIINFGELILLEILNNYKYVLLGFYGGIIGVILTGFITYIIFNFFNDGYAKLISLLIIMPIISFLIIFLKGVFEIGYYKYFKLTGNDNLGDIYKQILDEETQDYKKRFIESQK